MSVATSLIDPAASRRVVTQRLRLLRFGLWVERIVSSAGRGLCIGLAIALAGAFVLVIQSDALDQAVLMLIVSAGALLGALWGMARPPSRLLAARTADARLGLQARLGTAAELLGQKQAGRLGEAQLADTARAIRSAGPRWRYSLAAVRRQLAVAALMALLLGVALRLEGRGSALLISLPPAQRAPEPDGRPVIAGEAGPAAAAGQPGAKTASALRSLDELRRAREAGQIAPDQASAALDQVQSELNQSATEARQQRQTLDRLASALSEVSASQAAANSIERGDYGQAGQQLAQLGEEADQLSAEAKSRLSQALRRAATESQADRALADRERRAGDALAGRDYQAVKAALAALGDEVARASGQTASQDELSQAMARVEQERRASDDSNGAGDRSAGIGSASKGQGQSGGSQAGEGEGSGQGSGRMAIQPDSAGLGQDPRPPQPDGPAEKAASGAPGLGAPRLDVAGKEVEVPVRPGDGSEPGLRADRPAGDEQTIDVSQTTAGSDQSSGAVQAGGQIERMVVPGDQRQIVRDYFGKRDGRSGP